MIVRQATPRDAEAIAAIYNPFVVATTVTYELEAVAPAEMAERIRAKQIGHDWLALEDDGEVLGYGYYGYFRERAAYRHTVESSLYLAPQACGRGLGRLMYRSLFDRARDQGYREMVGVIALPNDASVALHESLGFTKVGILARSGYKFGTYLDTGFWQKSLVE